jgi:hypothetical protein
MFVCESSNETFFCAAHFVTCPEEAVPYSRGGKQLGRRKKYLDRPLPPHTVASNALTDMVYLTRADLGRIAEGYFVIDGAPMAIST